jgi:ferredoxin
VPPHAEQRLVVDPIACEGHGICAELLREWITLDDWGYPVIRDEPLPPEVAGRARWAVANCPALALKLRRAQTGQRPSVR